MPDGKSEPGAVVILGGSDVDKSGDDAAIVVGGGEDEMGILGTCSFLSPAIRKHTVLILNDIPQNDLYLRFGIV